MSPEPDRRQQRRGAKLAVILEAAWTLARRDGLAAISLRDLGDAVGLRQPSLYVYFDSKLDLYDAMFADGWRQFLDCVRHDYPGADCSFADAWHVREDDSHRIGTAARSVHGEFY